MELTPISVEKNALSKTRYGWTIIAFGVVVAFVMGLMVWQLLETSPPFWCKVAEDAALDVRGACFSLIKDLIPVKDHTIIGLMSILGIAFISLTAVALGVRINAHGPGGTSVDVGAETTVVSNGDAKVEVHTPPSGDKL